MATSARPRTRRRPGRDLVLLFAFTILLPGLVLSIMGVWALLQQQSLTDQQIRQRIDAMAARAATRVDRDLTDWRNTLERTSRSGAVDPASLPAWIAQAQSTPGSMAIVVGTSADVRTWPERATSYRLARDAELARTPSPQLVAAEAIELRERDYARALNRYRALLPAVAIADRAELLLRTAIVERHLSQWAESLATLKELAARPGDVVGGVPADLMARAEICAQYAQRGPSDRLGPTAVDLLRDLVDGRWVLDQPRFLAYLERAEDWSRSIADPDAIRERDRLKALASRKLALTQALADLVESGRLLTPMTRATIGAATGSWLTAWTSVDTGSGVRFAAMVVDAGWLQAHVWPDILAPAVEAGFVTRVLGETGPVYETAPVATIRAYPDAPVGSRPVDVVLPIWRIEVRPKDAAALYAESARGRNVLVAMLGATFVLLAFGTYFTARVVRREMEVARMKSDFVSAVSHEFRSPLTGIRQLAELLARGRVPSEARRQEYYDRLTHEADRLSRVVENLLDVARMEEGRKAFAFEPVDTGPWLTRVVEEFRPIASAAGHEIAAAIPPELPSLVGDREALACVVHNLLDNAVKYSPDEPTVWLDASASNGHIAIRVRDRGIGIAQADRSRLFERFFRGSNVTAERTRGVGLGLNLTQHIVAAHGGRIEVESAPAAGSTFSIFLKTVAG